MKKLIGYAVIFLVALLTLIPVGSLMAQDASNKEAQMKELRKKAAHRQRRMRAP